MSERIEKISAQLRGAAEGLVATDGATHDTYLKPEDLAHNPYVTASAHDGKIDGMEAARARHPLARTLYTAASQAAGTPYAHGGIPGGFAPAIMPAHRLEYGHLRNFVVHVEAIVVSLDGNGDGKLGEAEIALLPQAIEAYFRAIADRANQRQLTHAAFHKRVEALVREAYAAK
jgi:hypothetical protein